MKLENIDIETLTKREQEITLSFLKGKKTVSTHEIRSFMYDNFKKFKLFEGCIIIHNREYFSLQRPIG